MDLQSDYHETEIFNQTKLIYYESTAAARKNYRSIFTIWEPQLLPNVVPYYLIWLT